MSTQGSFAPRGAHWPVDRVFAASTCAGWVFPSGSARVPDCDLHRSCANLHVVGVDDARAAPGRLPDQAAVDQVAEGGDHREPLVVAGVVRDVEDAGGADEERRAPVGGDEAGAGELGGSEDLHPVAATHSHARLVIDSSPPCSTSSVPGCDCRFSGIVPGLEIRLDAPVIDEAAMDTSPCTRTVPSPPRKPEVTSTRPPSSTVEAKVWLMVKSPTPGWISMVAPNAEPEGLDVHLVRREVREVHIVHLDGAVVGNADEGDVGLRGAVASGVVVGHLIGVPVGGDPPADVLRAVPGVHGSVRCVRERAGGRLGLLGGHHDQQRCRDRERAPRPPAPQHGGNVRRPRRVGL